ncbi:hypothetical protein GA0115255_101025 [Streptomyces sp. Ncost-T6T-2b]|nr:hypothetical protein GA0115255_101025 [Streptomyces sp. Ncost-T6T-2b]
MDFWTSAIRFSVRCFSSVPADGTPRASATVSIRRPTSDSPLAGSTTSSGMPASRIWSMASDGPVVVSARTIVGLRESTLSAETSWARVTTGSLEACSKVAVMSRATTCLPKPRVKTISLSDPVSGTIRSVESIVTSLPSAESTVTGSFGAGAPASGSTRSASAALLADADFGAESLPPPQPVRTRAKATAAVSAAAALPRAGRRRSAVATSGPAGPSVARGRSPARCALGTVLSFCGVLMRRAGGTCCWWGEVCRGGGDAGGVPARAGNTLG